MDFCCQSEQGLRDRERGSSNAMPSPQMAAPFPPLGLVVHAMAGWASTPEELADGQHRGRRRTHNPLRLSLTHISARCRHTHTGASFHLTQPCKNTTATHTRTPTLTLNTKALIYLLPLHNTAQESCLCPGSSDDKGFDT